MAHITYLIIVNLLESPGLLGRFLVRNSPWMLSETPMDESTLLAPIQIVVRWGLCSVGACMRH